MGFFGRNRSGHKTNGWQATHRRTRPLGIETFEPRLTMSWGGVPPSIVSPTPAVALTLNAANQVSRSATIAQSEADYYSFVAPKAGVYSVATSTTIDTVLGVFNASGRRIAYNDDFSSSNRASRTNVSLSAGQRYYVGVSNYTGSANGNYTLSIAGPAPTSSATTRPDDSFESNDTFSTASQLGTLTSTRTLQNLAMADSHDYYRFTITTAGNANSYVSTTFNTAQGNLDLRLLNSAGQQLRTSQTSNNTERISLQGLAAGTYVIDVYGRSGGMNPNYTLQIAPPIVTVQPAPPPTTSGAFDIVLVSSGLTTRQQSIFNQAVARWEQIIAGDLPNAIYNGVVVDDLLIHARVGPIDGVGNILGQAGPDAFRSGSMLPYHGVMEFDSADVAAMEANGSLYSVVVHEIAHILGLGTLWGNRGLVTGAGTSNPRYSGPNAVAAYNSIFGVHESGVPVENTGGGGTRDAHWREGIFSTEVMTGFAGPGNHLPISRITVGALADLGYRVNMSAADTFVPPTSVRSLTTTSVATTSQPGLVAGDSRANQAEPPRAATAAELAFWNWPATLNEERGLREPGSPLDELLAALL